MPPPLPVEIFLASELTGEDPEAALKDSVRHNKALEDYQAAYDKYLKDRNKLLDWIAMNDRMKRMKEQAEQNFTDTDCAFTFYNQTHQNEQITTLKEPKFSDFYQHSEQQKQGELLFIGASTLALWYAAFRFL